MLRLTGFLATALFLALPGRAQDGEDGKPKEIGWLIGLTGKPFLSYGALVEADFAHRFALQLQYFENREFQGIFPKNEILPYEDYRISGINAGIYSDLSYMRFGLFVGAQYVQGVVRGKFLRSEPWSDCAWFGGACRDSGENQIYEPRDIAKILFPLKPSIGLHWGAFGISFSPQFYWDERLFYHLEFNLLLGKF